MTPEPLIVDDAPHPNGSDRYAIYEVLDRDHRWLLTRIAETRSEGVISTLETLYEENQIARGARVGIRDRAKRRWIINPFVR